MALRFSQGGSRVTQVTEADIGPVKARQRGANAGKPRRQSTVQAGSSGHVEVVALDPGGTTGWAVFSVHPYALSHSDVPIVANIQHWSCGEISGSEETQCQEAIELLEAWPTAAVVIEDFILRQFNKGRELLSPVRITAVLSYWLYENGREWNRQQPAMAKTTMTDERLKAIRMYRPGEEHATDAIRHGLTFLRRNKEQPRLRRDTFSALYDRYGADREPATSEPRRRSET